MEIIFTDDDHNIEEFKIDRFSSRYSTVKTFKNNIKGDVYLSRSIYLAIIEPGSCNLQTMIINLLSSLPSVHINFLMEVQLD